MSEEWVPVESDWTPVKDPKEFARAKAAELGIPWDVANAHITVESNWNANAKAGGGWLGGVYEPPSSAKGMMQLIDSTAKRYGVKDPMDPYQNISGGLSYLKDLHDQFGDWYTASQAYKQGEGSISKYGANAQTNAHMKKLEALSGTLSAKGWSPVGEESSDDGEWTPVKPNETSMLKEAGKSVGGAVGFLADMAPYFSGVYGLASQAVPGLAGGATTAYQLATGHNWTYSAMKGSEVMDRVAAWTTPTRLATEKLGIPKEALSNNYKEFLDGIVSYIPHKMGEWAMKDVKNEPTAAVSYAVANLLGNAALFGAAGGIKTTGMEIAIGNKKISDYSPFNIFKDNANAAKATSYTPVWGAERPGLTPADQLPIDNASLNVLPRTARDSVKWSMFQKRPLPSIELENIFSRDAKTWGADDLLTIISWDKEMRSIQKSGGAFDISTGYKQIPKVSEGQSFWAFNPVRPIFDFGTLKEALGIVRTKPHSLDTETLPTKYVWAMRSEDRGITPKSNFQATARSVEQKGITEPIEILYSWQDNAFLMEKGNTKIFTAMRENIPEVPVYVRVKGNFSPKQMENAVSADILGMAKPNVNNKIGGTVKPSDVNLPSRDLLSAMKDPMGTPLVNPGTMGAYWWSSPRVAQDILNQARKQALGFRIQKIVSLTNPTDWKSFRNTLDPKEVNEITSGQKTMYGSVFSPEQAGEMSRNPLINWTASIISDIKKNSDMMAESWKFGTSITRKAQAFGLRTTNKVTQDPNAWVTILKNMSSKELTALRNFDIAWEKTKTDPTVADMQRAGLNQRQITAYQAKQKFNDSILKELNSVHKELGLPEIERLPGYTTAVRRGDFYVEAKDAKGNTHYREQIDYNGKVLGVPLGMWGASRIKRAVEKAYPGMKVEVGEVTKGPGNPFAVSVMQLENMNHFISELGAQRMKDLGIDPYTPFLIERVIDARREAGGFGGHKQQKQFVPGAKGNEILKRDRAKNSSYIEAQELYAQEAANYVSNLMLDRTIEPLLRDPILGDKPNLSQLLRDIKENGKGAYDINGTDALGNFVINLPFKALGMGSSAGHKFIGAWTRAGYFSWLHLKPGFYLSQITQPLQFTPPELAHWQAQGFKGNITGASLKGMGDLIMPSKGFLDYVEHGIKTQTLDPQLIRKMGIRAVQDIPVVNYLIGEKIQAHLEKAGRLMTAATAYNFFKDSGIKDAQQLHHLTDQVVNNVMVDFHRTSAPAMYKSGSYIGEAAGVLSRYHHNYVAQFAKYVNDFRETGAVKPIGLFLATQALAAGLVGFVGVKETDWMIEKLRSMGVIEPDFPTATEFIMKNVADLPAFGVPSMLTGLFMQKPANVSGSVGAPTNVPSFSSLFPQVQWGTNIVTSAWNAMSPGRAHTDYEWMDFMTKTMPSFARWPVEKLLGNIHGQDYVGGDFSVNYAKRGVGGIPMDEGDWQARMWNLKSIDESRNSAILGAAKAVEGAEKDRIYPLIGALAEGLKGDERIDVQPILEELLQYSVTPDQAVKLAKDLIINQNLDANIQFHGINPKSLNAIQKFYLLQKQHNDE